MILIEGKERVKETQHRLEAIGLTDLITAVAATAVCLGAKEVLAVHGKTPKQLQLMFKTDGTQSPRTVADLRSGSTIKSLIRENFPFAQINEEETGLTEGIELTAEVDPLDGTYSFSRGQRYSVIGTEFHDMDGKPLAAAICNPFEKEVIIAQEGKGTFLFKFGNNSSLVGRPQRLTVSDRKTLHDICVYLDGYDNEFNRKLKAQFRTRLDELSKVNPNGRMSVNWRSSGSNIDQQRQVAAGRAEVTLTDAKGGFYDFAGRLPIAEAGGKFTDQFGNPVSKESQFGIGTNGWLHEQLIGVTSDIYRDYQGYNPKPL